jgi:hypothetical protein
MQLVKTLDSMDVQNNWLAGKHIPNWRTGRADQQPLGQQPHTHCSAFVAAVCHQFSVAMLLPPPQQNLANRQHDWLAGDGQSKGWQKVTMIEAQRRANAGHVVVAAFKNSDPAYHGGHGHVAIVRPSNKDEANVAAEGPQVTQAGAHNYTDAALKRAFPKRAWKKHQIDYFSYQPPGRSQPAADASPASSTIAVGVQK